ncbi:MAG: serine/threonine-protein phosphatase [Phycisphaerales bacterium]|nr:serine/threonine-protein phosphatase [Phycisphaerales bacterium]
MPSAESIPEVSKHELDTARMELLRKRVSTFGTALGALVLALAGVQAGFAFGVLHLEPKDKPLLRVALSAGLGVMLIVLLRRRRAKHTRLSLRALVFRTNWLVIMAVFSQVQGATVIARGITEILRPLGYDGNLGPMLPLVAFLACVHTAAAIIVPWTILEASIAPLTLAVFSLGASLLAGGDSPGFRAAGFLLNLAAGLPGIAITVARSGALREMLALRLIGDRYAEVSRELSTARRIHEKLFPAPLEHGPIRMLYRYEPMRQIGGDYLDAVRHADGSLSIAMVDVTGHGISAALAVNRLHGELKRLYAQGEDASPSRVVGALNEYVCLTLADEEVFATAAAIRLEPGGRFEIAIAGHPPALLRRKDRSVERIDSTAMMLGVLGPPAYEAGSVDGRLEPGDTLLLYTDGAMECHDARGRQLGIVGLQAAIADADPTPSGALHAVFRSVEAHRDGPPEDDTLVVALAIANP